MLLGMRIQVEFSYKTSMYFIIDLIDQMCLRIDVLRLGKVA